MFVPVFAVATLAAATLSGVFGGAVAYADTPPAGPFTDGTYLVGTDMPAGNYVTDGTGTVAGDCYWARHKNDGGSAGDIIANNVGAGKGRFTARNGEVVELSLGCTWTKAGG
jgi:hypothetical protein